MQQKRKKKTVGNASLESSFSNRPFDRLKGLIDRKKLPSSSHAQNIPQIDKEPTPAPQSEEQLFLEAMEGVNPIAQEHAAGENNRIQQTGRSQGIRPENEALSRLVRLVTNGEGFLVSDTPEYIEGTGYNVHQEFARRLHQGEFSIQAHIDLHGLNVEQAKEVFETFLDASINSGKRAVLIIHGRGLSSPHEPVLKNKVREWLSQGYWRKRVIAYASAQSYDGGTGATYVLLRDRPVSKRSGKTRPGA